MTKTTDVHGISVTYEENVEGGISHLRDDLDYGEAKVFFDQARFKGSAPFEDDEERQYTLVYRGGVYFLTRR